MEKYFVTLTKEELNCLKQALSIAKTRLNRRTELAYGLEYSIMGDAYKREEIKAKKLLDKFNDLK